MEDARRQAEWMLEALTGRGRAALYAYPERDLTSEQCASLNAWIARRVAGEPIQYVLGEAEFCGLRLRVTPAVLIPRPETEEVVGHALEKVRGVPQPRVLDVGTGSGCIALALKAARPDADVHALDVSRAALAVARENAERLGLSVAFYTADLRAPDLDAVPGPFSVIVSNPPYIPDAEKDTLEHHVRDFEPALALFSGSDPLVFYHALARHARRLLVPGGYLVTETHADHAQASAACFTAAGLTGADVRADLYGRPRVALAQQPPLA